MRQSVTETLLERIMSRQAYSEFVRVLQPILGPNKFTRLVAILEAWRGPGTHSAKLAEVQARLAATEAHRTDLVSGLNKPLAVQKLDDRAERLLRGEEPNQAGDDRADLRQDYGETLDRLRVLGRAVEKQTERAGNEQNRVSHEVNELLEPEHRAIVNRIARALETLTDALIEEQRFREALASTGVFLVSLRPMPFPQRRTDLYAADANLWMREAARHGLLDRGVPSERAVYARCAEFAEFERLNQPAPAPGPPKRGAAA